MLLQCRDGHLIKQVSLLMSSAVTLVQRMPLHSNVQFCPRIFGCCPPDLIANLCVAAVASRAGPNRIMSENDKCWSEQTASTMTLTNPIDLSTYNNANLSFDWDCDANEANDGMTVYVNSSADSWIVLLPFTAGDNTGGP